MNKKITSIAIMLAMAFAIMPVSIVHAADETTVTSDLKLETDRTTQIVIPSGSTVTLDLNGHKIKVSDSDAILNSGTLTITDSVGGGEITAYSTDCVALAGLPDSKTTIHAASLTSYGKYVVKNLGDMTFENNFEHIWLTLITQSSSNSDPIAIIDNGWHGDAAHDTINNVNYSTIDHSSKTANLVINNGRYRASYDGDTRTVANVWNAQNGNLTINNGAFFNTPHATTIINENIATINNIDEYTATYGVVTNGDGTTNHKGITSIYGGYISGSTGSVMNSSATAITTVYGGKLTGTVVPYTGTNSNMILYGGEYVGGGTLTDFLGKNAIYTKEGVQSTDNKEYGNVSTKTIVDITKYVLYKSIPGATTFNYTIHNTGTNPVQEASTLNGKTYEKVNDGINVSQVQFTTTGTNTNSLTYSVDDYNSRTSTSGLPTAITSTQGNIFYSSKQMFIDFNKVEYSQPGIYRYVLTETCANNTEMTVSADLYIDVWVARASGTPGTTGYDTYTATAVIPHTGTALSADKTSSYEIVDNKVSYLKSESTMLAENLTVKHESLGNQASRTKAFNYRLNLKNVTPNSVIAYVTSSSSTTGLITADSNGNVTYNFSLLHDQAITFINLSEYPEYTVTLLDGDNLLSNGYTVATKLDNYKLATDTTATEGTAPDTTTGETNSNGTISGTTLITQNNALADAVAAAAGASNIAIHDTLMQKDTTVVLSVYKEGTVPTGIILNIAPYAAVVLAGFFGLIIFAAKKKSAEEDA
jgi:hypothetical protein